MAQENAQRAESDETQPEGTGGFSTKPSTIKAGHGIQLKTWTNTGKHGEFPTVSIERSYKDGEEWKTQKITNMGTDSLLSTARALEQAYDAIMAKQQEQGKGR